MKFSKRTEPKKNNNKQTRKQNKRADGNSVLILFVQLLIRGCTMLVLAVR